jgi:hypothetical protein
MSGDGIYAEEQPVAETRNDGQPSEVYLVQTSTTFHIKFNYYIYVSEAFWHQSSGYYVCETASSCTILQPALMVANSKRRCVHTQLRLHVVLIVHILRSGSYSFVHILW